MEKEWTGPSKEQWDRMQRGLDQINEHVFGIDADGRISPHSEKSIVNVILRMTEVMFGPEGERARGLDRRTEYLERARQDEAQQRKGAMWVIGVVGTFVGGVVTAAVTWLLEHGKKP